MSKSLDKPASACDADRYLVVTMRRLVEALDMNKLDYATTSNVDSNFSSWIDKLSMT